MATKHLFKEALSRLGPLPDLDLSPIQAILGDKMPKLDATTIGRHRMLMAFRNLFGDNFRSTPGVEQAIKHYDNESGHVRDLLRIKMDKMRGRS